MELTSTTLTDTSLNQIEKPEIFVIDIGNYFPTIMANLNLLPDGMSFPDNEAIIKMALSAVQSRYAPAPQVLKAKCEHIFKDAPVDVKETIFVSLLALGLTIIESYNHFQLWSDNGNAMYEFDRFVNNDTVALRRVKSFSYY